MVTEDGTVKTSLTLDEKVYGELNKNIRNLSILYIVGGAIIFVLGCVLFGISAYEGTDDGDYTLLIIAGLVFVALGVFFLAMCRNSAKTALKIKRVEEVEFFGDHMIVKQYSDGELTATNKVYYKWIVKVRETKNYLFLYNTGVTAVGVDKNSLPLNELNTIRSLLAKAQQSAPVQTVQNTEKPADPFSDIIENEENNKEE